MDNINKLVERQLAAKAAYRRRQAALPVSRKIEILIQLQKLAAPLLRAQGLKVRVWKI